VAVLQARTSSTRLPGKVLADLCGRPMLARQVERVSRARRLDDLVVATSDQPGDDALADLCREMGVACFRGSLEDVLDRFASAAARHRAEAVVRLTGDCPLADPGVIDATIGFFLEGGYDYAANCRPPTLPDGLDTEVFTFAALEAAWREAADPFEREHVVPFIIRRPGRFRIGNLAWPEDRSGLRWTVDEPRDLDFVRAVYAALFPANPAFGWEDVLRLLAERPELAQLNSGIPRNQGSQQQRNA